MRISAFPFYAGIKGPLSRRETVRKCVRAAAPLEPLDCLKNSGFKMCVFRGLFGEGCREVSWKLVDGGKLERSGAGSFLAGTKSAMGDCVAVTQTIAGWGRLTLLGGKVQSCDLSCDLL